MRKRLPIVALLMIVAVPNSPPGRAQHLRKPSKHSGTPIVAEFVGAGTESPQDQIHRQIREEQYGDRLTKPLVDPGLTVDGQTETTRLTVIDYVIPNDPDPPGMPVSRSAAVIIGTVLGGKCFINKAHTYVYTDYQVRIDQILMPDPTGNLRVGTLVAGKRYGGAIHFLQAM